MTMSRLSLPSFAIVAAAVALPTLVPASPAFAQSGRVREIEVFGNDPCPRSTDDDVIICARKSEKDRYRIPERLRQGGSLQARQSWASRALAFETYGKTGINSCSAVGPGGHTGCMNQIINQAFKEREEQTAADTTPDE